MEEIICGDSLIELGKLADESVDLLCTDPPYGYSFMGKSWDKTLPDIGIFKECFRVMKAGAFAFVMSAPRSDVCARMMLMLEEAGFNIGFTPIYWTYASGFPKAMNIGKMVDKKNGTSRKIVGDKPNYHPVKKELTANTFSDYSEAGIEGIDYRITETGTMMLLETKGDSPLESSYGGFQPKPAVEVVIVAMKPLSEKTFVDQALKNGKGITWLDDCRIPIGTETVPRLNKAYERKGGKNFGGGEDGRLGTVTGGLRPINKLKGWSGHGQLLRPEYEQEMTSQGRFPANLLVSDDVLNDGSIRKSSAFKSATTKGERDVYGSQDFDYTGRRYSDEGSYSRFFSLDAWAKTLPFLIVPKASKREKNEGLTRLPVKQTKGGGGMNDLHLGSAYGSIKAAGHNHHPTVKPLTLMSYLITLGSRPNDVVLDPFLGSGTTALAAKQLGRKYIGIEREEEYVEIARARLKEIQTALF